MAAPSTQFEIDGGITNLATETAFLEQVATDTDATLTTAGLSNQGRPIHRLDVGNPAGTTWVIMVLVHTDEPASREAALAFVRDLAYSTDPTITGYLAQHRVVLLTPQNPDGLANGWRDTPQGDINKDHLKFNTAPARVLQNTLREIDPHLVLDAHERFGDRHVDFEHFGIATLALHEQLRTLSDEARFAAADAANLAGYEADHYIWPGRVSGREAAAFHHSTAVLIETFAPDPLDFRVGAYLAGLEGMRAWHAANGTQLAAAKAASKAAALANEPVPYPLQTGDVEYMGRWPRTDLDPLLIGYEVTGTMPTTLMDAYGVVADGTFVPMAQEARVLVPLLFDPQSANKATTATPVLADPPPDPDPDPEPPSTGLFTTDGKPIVLYRTDGTPAFT